MLTGDENKEIHQQGNRGNSLDVPLNSQNYHLKKAMTISKKNYYFELQTN